MIDVDTRSLARAAVTAAWVTLSIGAVAACGQEIAPDRLTTPSHERYRLAHGGTHWDESGRDRIVEDLLPRYPEFFAVILDPSDTREPDLRELRDDLERDAADRRSFDALNAIAVGYFELNYRAQSDRGGSRYLADSFRAAKLLAVPWRAYGEVEDPRVRDAILDFFEDAATGEKLSARETAGRIRPIVAALESKESDLERQRRIQLLLRRMGPEAR